MNKTALLITATLTLALLAGCDATGDQASSSSYLTLSGSTSAAKQALTVEAADGSVLATATTDSLGAYKVEIEDDSTLFPLHIEVKDGDSTLEAVVPQRGAKGEREIKAHVNDLSNRAFHRLHDSLEVAQMDSVHWHHAVREEAKEYVEAEGLRHLAAATKGWACLQDQSLRANLLDSVESLESQLPALREELDAQLAAGDIEVEDFIEGLENAFEHISDKAKENWCGDKIKGGEEESAVEEDAEDSVSAEEAEQPEVDAAAQPETDEVAQPEVVDGADVALAE